MLSMSPSIERDPLASGSSMSGAVPTGVPGTTIGRPGDAIGGSPATPADRTG